MYVRPILCCGRCPTAHDCWSAGGRWRCLSRLCSRGALVLDLLDVLDLPGRTAELARTYGIDFFSVINR